MYEPKEMCLMDIYHFSKYLIGFAKTLSEIPLGKQKAYMCAKCESSFSYTYLENRIYLVVCGKCGIASLVEAGSAALALAKVGVSKHKKES